MINSQPDNDDISGFIAGDRKAYEKVYKHHYLPIYNFANGIVKNDQEAKDIAMEAFIKLWGQRDKFKDRENVKAFLWVITRNACFDYLRSIRRRNASHGEILYLSKEEERMASFKSFDFELIEREVIEVLSQIEALTPRCKDVVKLIFFHGMQVWEIAQQLNISPGTVRYHKTNAIKQLKNVLLKNNLLSSD